MTVMKNNTKVSSADIPHVGKGTPAGEWFRRYWMVVGTTRDLHDIPQAVKVLGEELVLFRDEAGRLGLLGKHCPHRGASLEYGDIEDAGLRCPYHGWLFDVHGQCLAMPAEPKDDKFTDKVKHLSYPVRELGELIFAYLGPDEPPPLPNYRALADSAGQRSLEATRLYDYNWFNFIENGADPAHFSTLHRADPNDGFTQGLNRLRTDKEFSMKVLSKYTQVTDPETLAQLHQTYGVRYSGDRIPYLRAEGVDEILKRTP